MEDVETYTQRKRGCRYVIYCYDASNIAYEGNGGNTLDEARRETSKLSRPGLELHIWEGDCEHPDAKEVE